MQKIILYYKFVPVPDPETAMCWQRDLCKSLGLKGRIIISKHGINGTLGGDIKNVKAYVKAMNQHSFFKNIEFKWSDGEGDDFPRLSVKVRDELVTLAPGEEFDVFNSTKGLRPKAWHEYLEAHPDVIVLDARNEYESDVGIFDVKNLIAPKIGTFKEIKKTLEELPKDKTILTYCTGDIRCEYLSAYMRHKGFQDVYHLDGGIVKYGEAYKDEGKWKGKCFVFDKRMGLAFSDKSEDIGHCSHCNELTSRFVNCEEMSCHDLVLVCEVCNEKFSTRCGVHGVKVV
jgi:UPF0176 protein